MLTRLPALFHSSFVMPDESLEFAHTVATRQRRLVKGVFAGALALSALAFTPQFSGPGPVLSWAARQWPETFGGLALLLSQPMTTWELAGSAGFITLLVCACLRELRGLSSFLQSLEPLEAGSSVRDAVSRLCASTPTAAAYVQAVSTTRELRIGDWRVVREIAEAGQTR